MTRVLIVTRDVVGERMAGPAIRAWELARVLSADHSVTVAAQPPVPSDEGLPFKLIEAGRRGLASAGQRFDVALVQGEALYQFPGLRNVPYLVIDLYDPFILENLESHLDEPRTRRHMIHVGDLGIMRHQVIAGDFFLCASERQRHYWIGMLSGLNRVNPLTYEGDNTLRRLIDVVPFGLSEVPVRQTGPGLRDGKRIGPEDVVVLWGGGIWNWFDPLTLLRAMSEAVPECPQLKLVFLGTRHPNPHIPRMRMAFEARQLADELGLTGRHVFFNDGWVPYAERQNALADADIGVSLHYEHVESVYSFRTRVLDYLWAGLPMVLTTGDEMAEFAQRSDLGIVVDYRDVSGVAAALTRLARDKGLRRAYSGRVLEAARAFEWTRVAAPLKRYCDAPWRAGDHELIHWQLMQEQWLRSSPLSLVARKAMLSLQTEGLGGFGRRGLGYLKRHVVRIAPPDRPV